MMCFAFVFAKRLQLEQGLTSKLELLNISSMKKLAFLFLAGFLSLSTVWAAPDLSSVSGIQVFQTDLAPETCTITIKGTYDGKQIDVTVTVTADNCARAAGDLLKAFAKK